MRRALIVLAFFCPLAVAVATEDLIRFRGKLSPEPVVTGGRFMPLSMEPAPAEVVAKLPGPPAPDGKVSRGHLPVSRLDRKLDIDFYLVQPAQGEPYLFADLDRNGQITEAERLDLAKAPEGDDRTALLRIPSQVGFYSVYPIRLMLSVIEGRSEPTLLCSMDTWAEGTVDLGSRKLLVRYTIDPVLGTADPQRGWQGFDLDGDGKIGMPEMDSAFNESLIFRVGDLYLSTESLSPEGEIVLRTHPASDYVRFDLAPGSQIPDFPFTDLAGKSRRLAELRGKVVLLDFWGTWCAPCVEDLPLLQEAYGAFQSRGFEILSLDYNDDVKTLQKLVDQKKLPWTHARAESVKEIVDKRFRVHSFPTLILLDREGKVVVPSLESSELKKKLEELLPAAGPAR
jgi:thiol-disulfide isomerase/thioredoxin